MEVCGARRQPVMVEKIKKTTNNESRFFICKSFICSSSNGFHVSFFEYSNGAICILMREFLAFISNRNGSCL